MATYEQLRAAQRKAHNAGDVQAAKRYTERIANNEYDDSVSNWRSGLRGFNQGTTLGLGEETTSGIAALGTTLFGPGESGITKTPDRGFFDRYLENYRGALESSREDLEASRREDPWITGLSEFGGGLTTVGLGGAANITRGKGLLEGAKSLAVQGGKIGGAAGYGYSEFDPALAAMSGQDSDVFIDQLGGAAGDVAKMTAIGGGMGLTLPFAGAGARAAGRGVINKISKLVNKPFTEQAQLTEEARKLVAKSFDEDVVNGKLSYEQLQRELDEIPGMTLADISPAVRDLAETMSQTNTPGARMVRDFFQKRHENQVNRIAPRLVKELGREDETFHVAFKNLTDDMERQGDKLYKEAYSEITQITPAMAKLFANSEMKYAVKHAKRLNASENPGSNLPALAIGELISGRDAHTILRGVRAHVNSLFTGQNAKKDLGNVVKTKLQKPLNDMITEQLPGLREAQKVWGDGATLKDAAKAGKRLFLDDPEVTADIVQNMTGAEKMMFKMSALNKLVNELKRAPGTANVMNKLMTPIRREALSAAFDNKTSFSNFMRYAEKEAEMAKTSIQAIANSASLRRANQQVTGEGMEIAGALGYEGGIRSSLLGPQSARYVGKQINRFLGSEEKEKAALAATSMAQGQRLLDPNLTTLQQPKTLGGLIDTGVPQSVSTGLQGLLATDLPQPDWGR